MRNFRTELQEGLVQAYCRYAEAKRNVRLPSTLAVERDGNTLLLGLTAKAVSSNMQTDAAAFEAWALILRVWLGAERVPQIVLHWDLPNEMDNGHYQRFLYRVAQFRTLFPEWFDIADPKKLEVCRALTDPQRILNVAKGERSRSQVKAIHPEAQLESRLIASDSFRQRFGLKLADRQFPIGLFAKTVSARTRIFTGGKSAIDIVGLGEDGKFFIFELKAGDNISAGTLSELLFYTSLIREAAQEPPRISFEEAGKNSRACVYPDHVKACTGIHAVMLVEKLHPLLARKDLFDTLNAAAAVHWNCLAGFKSVCFSKALVSECYNAAEASA